MIESQTNEHSSTKSRSRKKLKQINQIERDAGRTGKKRSVPALVAEWRVGRIKRVNRFLAENQLFELETERLIVEVNALPSRPQGS